MIYNYFSASIVLFNSNPRRVKKLIIKLKQTKKIFIIDNSKISSYSYYKSFNNVIYFHNPENPGFGASHNLAIKKSEKLGFKYHFIINPDVDFDNKILKKMCLELDSNNRIGLMMPKILNLDGSEQFLPKLIPSPLSMIMRILNRKFKIFNSYMKIYEFKKYDKKIMYNLPILSGSFLLLNLKIIRKIGLFDEHFFLYFEDWDLSRRVHKYYPTIFNPKIFIYHEYQSHANKKLTIFLIFLKSFIKYFTKWGWIKDNDKLAFNKNAKKLISI